MPKELEQALVSPSNAELAIPPASFDGAGGALADAARLRVEKAAAGGSARSMNRPAPSGSEGNTLTRRAQLTLGNTVLTQLAKFGCVLLMMPFVISRLGAELYGAWVMVQQLVGYLATGEIRATSTLKFSLSVTQHCEDHSRRKRQIGAALVLWLLSLPLMLAISAVLVVYAPALIQCAPEDAALLRSTIAITVATFLLGRLASIPNGVLRGSNLAYKAMGAGAATTVVGYSLMAFAASTRTPLPGMAVALLIQMVLLSGIELVVAKKVIPWIGVLWPTRRELFTFTGRTFWLSMAGIGALVLNASDLALVGYLLGPSAAGMYAVTVTASRLACQPLTHVLGSAVPGVAGICGAREWSRIAVVREEMLSIGICFSVVAGAVVIAMNESFVNLWVGSGFYVGPAANTLVALGSILFVLSRIDGGLLDCFLMIRRRAIWAIIVGAAALVAASVLCKLFGVTGVALAMFSGQALLACFYAISVTHTLRQATVLPAPTGSFTRLGCVCTVVLCGAWIVQLAEPSQTWPSLLSRSAAVAGVSSGLLYWFALNSKQRSKITARLRNAGR